MGAQQSEEDMFKTPQHRLLSITRKHYHLREASERNGRPLEPIGVFDMGYNFTDGLQEVDECTLAEMIRTENEEHYKPDYRYLSAPGAIITPRTRAETIEWLMDICYTNEFKRFVAIRNFN